MGFEKGWPSFTDGIRALAALYVVFHHAAAEIMSTNEKYSLSAGITQFRDGFFFERYAVDAFIVLSGFCLMLPALGERSSHLRLDGGVQNFLKRRFLRIYPPYVAALVVAMLLTICVPGMASPRGMRWDSSLPVFSPEIIFSHLLLIHNWSQEWLYKISYPLWTIATEWQIYFIFPLFLLALRTVGPWVALALVTVLGIAPLHFFSTFPEGASPWYATLFGMGAVTAYLTRENRLEWIEGRFPFPLIVVMFCLLEWVMTQAVSWTPNYLRAGGFQQLTVNIIKDIEIGLIFCFLIVFCQIQTRINPLGLLLESRPIRFLGGFSYSLYLIHAPILFVAHLWLQSLEVSSDTTFIILTTLGVLASVGAAFLFSLLCEAPLVRRLKWMKQKAISRPTP